MLKSRCSHCPFLNSFSLKSLICRAEDYYMEYLRIGSFPAVSLAEDEAVIEAINAGLFDSIFSRDILLRGKIRDEGTFFKVAKFVMENIGNSLSANSIKNTLQSNGHKITSDTVDNYLKLMCDLMFCIDVNGLI